MSLGFDRVEDGVVNDRSPNGNSATLEKGAKISPRRLGIDFKVYID